MKERSASKDLAGGQALANGSSGPISLGQRSPQPQSGPRPTSDEARLRERRRAYNRAYMRRWRANPRHAEQEGERRRRDYWRIKLRGADDGAAQSVDTTEGAPRQPRSTLCGFCGHRPSITRITRLKITLPSSEFVPIDIPYCGQC
jgi:hypothetical protein